MLKIDELIMPYFVVPGKNRVEPIRTIPQVSRLSVDKLLREIDEIIKSGIRYILLFGIARYKDEAGSDGYTHDGAVQNAVHEIKKRFPKLTIMTDVCLCEYTKSGHCGILKHGNQKKIVFDLQRTLDALARVALSHAQAGADFVCPSAMMKQQVRAIRDALDKNGFKQVKIMGYSAKFCSNFYGPFRDALKSAPRFGDRSLYQLSPLNKKQALEEVRADIKEGADIVMVKPALAYLDIISAVKDKFAVPLAAYNVSGEYSLVKVGGKFGILKEKEAVLEILTAIKRAGADLVITYHAKDVARWLR